MKSLCLHSIQYLSISILKNDNLTGHTATVTTPLKQGISIRPELRMIKIIPESIDNKSIDNLVSQILSKSRTAAKINKVLIFDKISLMTTSLMVIATAKFGDRK